MTTVNTTHQQPVEQPVTMIDRLYSSPSISKGHLEEPKELDPRKIDELINSQSQLPAEPIDLSPFTIEDPAETWAAKRKSPSSQAPGSSLPKPQADAIFFSHLFLDKNIKETHLEGTNFPHVISHLMSCIENATPPSEKMRSIKNLLQELRELDLLIKKDVDIPFDELFFLLKKELRKHIADSLVVPQDAAPYLLAASERAPFTQEIHKIFNYTTSISSDCFREKKKRAPQLIKEALTALLADNIQTSEHPKRAKSEKKEDTNPNYSPEKINTILDALINKLTFLEIISLYAQRGVEANRAAVDDISQKIRALQEDEKIYIPWGYFSPESSHAMIVVLEKVTATTFDVSVVNTGDGIQYHGAEYLVINGCNHIDKQRIEPIITFVDVNESFLQMQADAPSPFLQWITSTTTAPYFLNESENYPSFSPGKSLYKTLISYLAPYLSQRSEDYDSSLITHPQRSGTCVWNCIKTLIQLELGNRESYTKFSLHVKIHQLGIYYQMLLQLSKTASIETLKEHLCLGRSGAQSFLNSLYNSIHDSSSISPLEKKAIATSYDLIARVEKSLKEIDKLLLGAKRDRTHATIAPYHLSENESIQLQMVSYTKPLNIEKMRAIQTTCPIFPSIPPSIFSSLAHFNEQILKIIDTIEDGVPYATALVEEFLDSIPFPSSWNEDIQSPENVLSSLVTLQIHYNQLYLQKELANPEMFFLRNWKLFLIAKYLVDKIEPTLLDEYLLDCMFFHESYHPPLQFITADPQVQYELRGCLDEVQRHNAKVTTPREPLFHMMHHVLIEAESERELIEKNATLHFYVRLIEKNRSLREHLENIHILQTEENDNLDPIYLVGYLFKDFHFQSNAFSLCNLEHIYDLKIAALYANASLLCGSKVNLQSLSSNFTHDHENHRLEFSIPSIQGIDNETENFIFQKNPYEKRTPWESAILALVENEIRTKLCWSLENSSPIEALLLNHQELLSEHFGYLNRKDTRLLIDLITAYSHDKKCFEKVLSLFSLQENKDALSQEIFLHIFLSILFSSKQGDILGSAFSLAIQRQMSVKIAAESFFYDELRRILNAEITCPKRIETILSIALSLRLSVTTPFLVDWPHYLFDQALNPPQALERQRLLFRLHQYKHRDDSLPLPSLLLETLIASINVDEMSNKELFSLRIILENHGPFFEESSIFELCKNQIRKKFTSFVPDERTCVSLEYSKDCPVLWLQMDDGSHLGFDLLTHELLRKNSQGFLMTLGKIRKGASQSPFIDQLVEKYPFFETVTTPEFTQIKTEIGSFYTQEKAKKSAKETENCFIMSEKMAQALPPPLALLQWHYITVPQSIDAQVSKNGKEAMPITKNDIDYHGQLGCLRYLPFEQRSIYALFAGHTEASMYVLALSQDLTPIYLMHVDVLCHVEIFDLKEKITLAPITNRHWLCKALPLLSIYSVKDSEGEKIRIYDEVYRQLEICIENNQYKIASDRRYRMVSAPPFLPLYLRRGLCFINMDNPSEYKIYVSAADILKGYQFFPKNQNPLIHQEFLIAYSYHHGEIHPETPIDEIFLCYEKVITCAEDRFEAIEKIPSLFTSSQGNEPWQAMVSDIIYDLIQGFSKTNSIKDEICLLTLTLASCYFANNEKLSFSELNYIEQIYRYYKTDISIPDRYFLSTEREKCLITALKKHPKVKKEVSLAFDAIENIQRQDSIKKQRHLIYPECSFPIITQGLCLKEKTIGQQTAHNLDPAQMDLRAFIALLQKKPKLDEKLFFSLLQYRAKCEKKPLELLIKIALCLRPQLITKFGLDKASTEEELAAQVRSHHLIRELNESLASWRSVRNVSINPTIAIDFSDRLYFKSWREPDVERTLLYSRGYDSHLCISYSLRLIKNLSLCQFQMTLNAVHEIGSTLLRSIDMQKCTAHHAEQEDHEMLKAAKRVLSHRFRSLSDSKDLGHYEQIAQIHPSMCSHEFFSFIDTLDEIVEMRKKKIIERAPYLICGFGMTQDVWETLCFAKSSYAPRVCFDTLLDAFLEGSTAKYIHDMHSTIKSIDTEAFSTGNEAQIQQLHEEVGSVLILSLWLRKLQRIKEGYNRGDFTALRNAIKADPGLFSNHTQDSLYELIFEYKTGMDIRQDQRNLVLKLASCTSGVGQLAMGGGKSAVILPLLIRNSCESGKIPIVVCLKSQVGVMCASLTKVLGPVFQQKVISIELKREELSEKNLQELLSSLSQAKEKKYVFVASSEALQAIDLEYLHLVCSDSSQAKKRQALEKILQIFSESTQCIVDEFAHIADVKKVTNFPLFKDGQQIVKVKENEVKIIQHLMLFLFSNEKAHAEKLLYNQQTYLSAEQITAMQQSVADHVRKTFRASFPHICFSLLENEFFDKVRIDATMKEKVSSMENQEAQTYLCLSHLFIHQLLPKLCHHSGGRTYGRTIDPESIGKIIPYQGVGSPSTTEFGMPYEAIVLHFLYAVQFGIQGPQLAAIQSSLLSKAQQRCQCMHIPLADAEESHYFAMLTGCDLRKKMDTEDVMRAMEKLEREKKEGFYENILSLEALTIAEHVGFVSSYLTSNPHDLFSQFPEVKGLTGTPWNFPIYGTQFQDNLLLSSSVEENIANMFCNKKPPEGLDHYAVVIDTPHPDILIAAVMDKLQELHKKDVGALIDTGGLLKHFGNREVAICLLKSIAKEHSDKQYVYALYFDRTDSSPLPDVPHYIRFNNKTQHIETNRLPDLSVRTLITHQINQNPYIVYYSERQTIGIDIMLKERAICLITVDKKTPIHDFYQGLLRARGYFSLQNAITIIPKQMVEESPRIRTSPSALLTHMKNVQTDCLIATSYKSYQMQIEAVFKRHIISYLTGEKNKNADEYIAKKRAYLHNFRSLLIKEDPTDPLELIHDTVKASSVFEQLQILSSSLLLCLDDAERGPIDKVLQTLLANARKNPFLQQGNIYALEQNHVELQVEKQREIQQLIQKETSLIQKNFSQDVTEELSIDAADVICHFQKKNLIYHDYHNTFHIAPLECRQILPSEATQWLRAFKSLLVTSNALPKEIEQEDQLFSYCKRHLHSLLVIFPENTLLYPVVIGLTHSESITAYEYLSEEDSESVYIINELGLPLIEKADMHLLHSFRDYIDQARVEMMIFNGHIQQLQTISFAAHRWLTDPSSNQKLRRELVEMICIKGGKKELLSTVDLLCSEQMLYQKHQVEQRAHWQIQQANALMQNGYDMSSRSILRKYPIELLDQLPPSLCYLLPKHMLARLTQKNQILSLEERDVIYLTPWQRFLWAQHLDAPLEAHAPQAIPSFL